MSKITIHFIVFACLAASAGTNCMLRPFKYKPWEQPQNAKITEKRKAISDMLDDKDSIKNSFLQPIVNATVVGKITSSIRSTDSEEKDTACFWYAIAQTTGSTVPIMLGTNNDTTSFDIRNFFDQTDNPQHNDLGVNTNKYGYIQHYSRVLKKINRASIRLESKWGNYPQIIQHDPFDTPAEYKNFLSFWTLKPEYASLEGKALLQQFIQQITHRDPIPLNIHRPLTLFKQNNQLTYKK